MNMLKLACQEGLAPGATLKDKLANLETFGYEGIEFWGGGLAGRVDEINEACEASPVKASTICAGYGGCPLDADKAQRDLAIGDTKKLLKVAGDIGAVGLIFVPIFGGPRLPDLSPYDSAVGLEKKLLAEYVKELAPIAADSKTLLLLEPLNRYETHLLCRLEQAVEIIEMAGDPPGVALMADFFHMNIEELDMAKAIREAAKHVKHVHLADSIRWLPGYGHTDFKPGFAALKEIGFAGYMALECAVPGDPMVDLPKCAEYLKGEM
jgi:sugar phosphate isomerase/epimerase